MHGEIVSTELLTVRDVHGHRVNIGAGATERGELALITPETPVILNASDAARYLGLVRRVLLATSDSGKWSNL